MSEGRIEVKVGEVQFLGQGDQDWVNQQFEKFLAHVRELIQLARAIQPQEATDSAGSKLESAEEAIAGRTLPSYLTSVNAMKIQVKKFLATAVWLEDVKGQKGIKTGDVTKALKESQLGRLGNPSDCLNKNVRNGWCEKDGEKFYVTKEGRKSLR